MKRVVIVGSPGAGKSTFAAKLAKIAGLPLVHLDYYYHETGKNYYEDKAAWVKRVKELMAEDSWIMDGNYSSTIPERFARADTIIYFDVTRQKALQGVVKRRLKYRNKQRPDMPDDWKEKANLEFLKYVWNFKKHSNTQQEIEKLRKTKDKKVIVFHGTKEAEQFLKML